MKIITSIATSFLLVFIKINVFAFPLYTKIMWRLEDKRSEKQKIEIVGNYTGTIQQLSNNQIEQIELSIYSRKLIFNSTQPFNLKKEYDFDLMYINYGEITSDQSLEYTIEIEKLTKDSLIFYIEEIFEKNIRLN